MPKEIKKDGQTQPPQTPNLDLLSRAIEVFEKELEKVDTDEDSKKRKTTS